MNILGKDIGNSLDHSMSTEIRWAMRKSSFDLVGFPCNDYIADMHTDLNNISDHVLMAIWDGVYDDRHIG